MNAIARAGYAIDAFLKRNDLPIQILVRADELAAFLSWARFDAEFSIVAYFPITLDPPQRVAESARLAA